MSPSPPPISDPASSPPPSTAPLPIHTYHCLCSTLVLATPYLIAQLPVRGTPGKDRARMLPLPRLRNARDDERDEQPQQQPETGGAVEEKQEYLPSLLLPALRPARKITLVQREDGYERRRVWRCARCGLGIGYEVENEDPPKSKDGVGVHDEAERLRVMFVLEDGLLRTESLLGAVAEGGGEKGGRRGEGGEKEV